MMHSAPANCLPYRKSLWIWLLKVSKLTTSQVMATHFLSRVSITYGVVYTLAKRVIIGY